MNYKHDCEHCKYLGSYQPTALVDQSYATIFDLYMCKKGDVRLVKARYGNAPSEYIFESYKVQEINHHSYFQTINEAKFRARKKAKDR